MWVSRQSHLRMVAAMVNKRAKVLPRVFRSKSERWGKNVDRGGLTKASCEEKAAVILLECVHRVLSMHSVLHEP